MTAFLKKVAQYVLSKKDFVLAESVFVFPNKRSGLFFRQYLTELIEKPVWSPEITDIRSFIYKLSKFTEPNLYTQLFILYDAYLTVFSEKQGETMSIERFIPWGKLILNDFNDIEKNLSNADDVFRVVAGYKDLGLLYNYLTKEQIDVLSGFWKNIELSSDSDQKLKFLRIWQVLPELFHLFNQKMEEKGFAAEGMIYREIALKAKNSQLSLDGKNYSFCGFFLLNKAEKVLFEHIKKDLNGSFFWDFDPFYMDKNYLDSTRILRANLDDFPPPEDFIADEKSTLQGKKIEVIGVSFNSGQAKTAGNILKTIAKNGLSGHFDHTAVVLPDENLLQPVLNSIPENAGTVNITMGFPVKNTPEATLLGSLCDLQRNARISKDNQTSFLAKNILKCLRNPVFRTFSEKDSQKAIREITTRNRVRLTEPDILEIITTKEPVFSAMSKSENPFSYFTIILKSLYLTKFEAGDLNSAQIILSLYHSIGSIEKIIEEYKYHLTPNTVFSIISEIIRTTTVPFEGEPLSGIQLMGVLETRCLDFKNLIVLSMNEGIWPKNTHGASFIPYNIRKGFDLPTHTQQNLISAYYFYRLLQQPEKIFLLYNTEAGDNDSGEISRFIYQLKYDLAFPLDEKIISSVISVFPPQSISVKKTEKIIEILNDFTHKNGFKRRFSPSALNTYLDCSLKFYFSYIAGISEKEVISEEIDHAVFGTILHKSLEIFYGNFLSGQQEITVSDLEISEEKIAEIVRKGFLESYKGSKPDDFEEGTNLLVQFIIRQYMRHIIGYDKKNAPFKILSLEAGNSAFKAEINIKVGDKVFQAGLRGIIDRIDLHDGFIRIIDYKTGKDKKEFNEVKSLFSSEEKERNKAVFQVFCYALLFQSTHPGNNLPVEPAIYNTRQVGGKDFNHRIFTDSGKTVIRDVKLFLPQFVENLENLISGIFDPSQDFIQTESEAVCKYCPYNGICLRK